MSFIDGLVPMVDELRGIADEFGVRPYRTFLVWIGWTPDVDGDGIRSMIRAPSELDLGTPEEMLESFSEHDLDEEVVGVGRPVLLRELELLPRPLVTFGGLMKSQDPVGLTERGGASVTRISMRYSEDLLMGLVAPFRDPERPDCIRPGIDFFWEVQEDPSGGSGGSGAYGCGCFGGYVRRSSGGFGTAPEAPPPRRRFHVSGTPVRTPDAFQWTLGLTRADGERGRSGNLDEVG